MRKIGKSLPNNTRFGPTVSSNRRKAAERLDIGLRTLQRKLKEYRGGTDSTDDEEEETDDGNGEA